MKKRVPENVTKKKEKTRPRNSFSEEALQRATPFLIPLCSGIGVFEVSSLYVVRKKRCKKEENTLKKPLKESDSN